MFQQITHFLNMYKFKAIHIKMGCVLGEDLKEIK